MSENFESLIKKETVTACAPCNNDVIGCQASNIRRVIANNASILTAFKNMKCAILAYINSVSSEFVQNIDHADEPLERARFNVLIESVIAGIHQALRSYTNGQIEPYFQLWIQTQDSSGNNLYNLGAGWLDGDKSSGCYDANGNPVANQTKDTCVSPNTWYGTENDVQYDVGNLAKLFPNKISLFTNCNKDNGIKGDEILYHYNPSVQLLYDANASSLYLKWSDANYNGTLANSVRCLFPLLSNENAFKSEVFVIVPPSPIVPGENNDPWETQETAYNFIRKDCLLDNVDLHSLISRIETVIRRCELTHQSLKLKLKMAVSDLVIDAIDPTN